MKKIEDMLDKLDDRLDSVDKTLIKQELNLAEHMRRTNILEVEVKAIHHEMNPIKSHIDKVDGGMLLIKTVGIVCSIVAASLAILRYMGVL